MYCSGKLTWDKIADTIRDIALKANTGINHNCTEHHENRAVLYTEFNYFLCSPDGPFCPVLFGSGGWRKFCAQENESIPRVDQLHYIFEYFAVIIVVIRIRVFSGCPEGPQRGGRDSRPESHRQRQRSGDL